MDAAPNEDKIWVSVNVKINMGNYESVDVSMGESRTVCPDEDRTALRMGLLRAVLKDAIAEGQRVKGKAEDLYPPKPSEPEGRRRRF